MLHFARSQPSTTSQSCCTARQSSKCCFSTARGVPGLRLPGRRALQQADSGRALPLAGARRSYSCRTQAVQRQGDSDNSKSQHNISADDLDIPDIWAPVPPTPALGRKRKVAALIAVAMLEITMTGKRRVHCNLDKHYMLPPDLCSAAVMSTAPWQRTAMLASSMKYPVQVAAPS